MALNYTFHEQEQCNICKHPTSKSKHLGLRLNKTQGFKPKLITGIAVSVIQCSNCNLIYSHPQPIPVNIQDHYGVPSESYWQEKYFILDNNYFSKEIGIVKSLLDFKVGMKALDIGAGIGKCMVSLEKSGFDTFGLEPSVTFREKAIQKIKIDPDKIKLGKLEELEYENEIFDFITFGAVLEHLYNPSDAIERALKWLKPGGIMQIEVPSSQWLIAKLFNKYYKIRRTNYVTNLSPMHEPYHLYEFDLKSFKALSKEKGFEIAKHEFSVCEIFHIPKIFHRLLTWYMRKTNQGLQLTVYLKKNN